MNAVLKRPRRPRDPAQLAKLVVDIATGEAEDEQAEERPTTAVRRKAGKSGGRSRAEKLSREEREEIARLAAQARWKKS